MPLSLRVSLRLCQQRRLGRDCVCLIVIVNDCRIDEFSVDDYNDGPDASEEDPNVEPNPELNPDPDATVGER